MKTVNELSRKLTIRGLCRDTYKYFFENWKNLVIIFGTFGVLLHLGVFLGILYVSPVVSTFMSFVISVIIMPILQVWVWPFVVEDQKFRFFSKKSDHSKQGRSFWRRVVTLALMQFTVIIFLYIWMLLGALAIFMFVYSILPPVWNVVVGGLLGAGLLGVGFWFLVRTCLLGPILACGDSPRGWRSLRVSWTVLKGHTLKVALGLIIVSLIPSLMLGVVSLGSSLLFPRDSNEFNIFFSCVEICTVGLVQSFVITLAVVYLGVLYRAKREKALALL